MIVRMLLLYIVFLIPGMCRRSGRNCLLTRIIEPLRDSRRIDYTFQLKLFDTQLLPKTALLSPARAKLIENAIVNTVKIYCKNQNCRNKKNYKHNPKL